MFRVLRNTALALVAMLSLTGCFKDVTTDTTLRIKTLVEEESGGERLAAEGCYGYIYYTAKEDWTVASYDDAVAKTITNIETGERLSEPNGESEPYTIEGSTNSYISIFQDKAPALVVVVYPEAQMYAYIYRKAEAENLPYTYLTLIFHRWKTGSYPEGSKEGYKWTVVAPEEPATPPANDENE
jgi:hypothetical protein